METTCYLSPIFKNPPLVTQVYLLGFFFFSFFGLWNVPLVDYDIVLSRCLLFSYPSFPEASLVEVPPPHDLSYFFFLWRR